MLTGSELGAAIAEAIRLKGEPKTVVAKHFGVRGPSIYDWIKHGRIDKKHLTELAAYFSDVVPPSHWGMDIPEPYVSALSQLQRLDSEIIRSAIILAKTALALGADVELVIERDPETFAQALRTAIAARQRRERDGVGSGSGNGEVGADRGSAGAQEAGPQAKPEGGRKRKRA